jgi:hypothetical protein
LRVLMVQQRPVETTADASKETAHMVLATESMLAVVRQIFDACLSPVDLQCYGAHCSCAPLRARNHLAHNHHKVMHEVSDGWSVWPFIFVGDRTSSSETSDVSSSLL